MATNPDPTQEEMDAKTMAGVVNFFLRESEVNVSYLTPYECEVLRRALKYAPDPQISEADARTDDEPARTHEDFMEEFYPADEEHDDNEDDLIQ